MEIRDTRSSRATLQVFDEKQAEEIFKMLLVTPLCNALERFAVKF